MSRFRMATPPDFRFAVTVDSHGWYALAPFDWDSPAKILRRTETTDGQDSYDVEISFDGGLVVKTDRAAMPVLRKRLRRMFQLDLDLAPFHKRCAATDSHAGIAKHKFGRLLCGSTVFEDAVKIIATTNTTWNQTKRMVANLVELSGPRSASGRAAFPAPQNVAASSVGELREVCRMGYRADSVYRLAAGITDGSIDLAAISDPGQSTEDLFRSYLTLPGIGPYGAAHLLAMDGRHDFIAVDTEFRSFVRGRYHGGRKVGDRALLRRYAKWGEWKYLAYWSELWESS